jgi:hypothetical protein
VLHKFEDKIDRDGRSLIWDKAAAKLLGVHRDTIHGWRHDGAIGLAGEKLKFEMVPCWGHKPRVYCNNDQITTIKKFRDGADPDSEDSWDKKLWRLNPYSKHITAVYCDPCRFRERNTKGERSCVAVDVLVLADEQYPDGRRVRTMAHRRRADAKPVYLVSVPDDDKMREPPVIPPGYAFREKIVAAHPSLKATVKTDPLAGPIQRWRRRMLQAIAGSDKFRRLLAIPIFDYSEKRWLLRVRKIMPDDAEKLLALRREIFSIPPRPSEIRVDRLDVSPLWGKHHRQERDIFCEDNATVFASWSQKRRDRPDGVYIDHDDNDEIYLGQKQVLDRYKKAGKEIDAFHLAHLRKKGTIKTIKPDGVWKFRQRDVDENMRKRQPGRGRLPGEHGRKGDDAAQKITCQIENRFALGERPTDLVSEFRREGESDADALARLRKIKDARRKRAN